MSHVISILKLQEKTEEFLRKEFPLTFVPDTERAFVLSQILRQTFNPNLRTAKDIGEEKIERLEEKQREFCRVVYELLDAPYYVVMKHLPFGRSVETVNAVKRAALDNDLIFEYKARLLKKETGRPPSRFWLLPKGYELIGKKPDRGNGKGYKQMPFVRHVRRYFESIGMETEPETYYLRPDISVRGVDGQQKALAVEVSWSTTVAQEMRNIRRDLDDGFESIWIVPIAIREERKNSYVQDLAEEKGKANALRQAIQREFPEDVERLAVKLLEEFRI